MSHSVRHTSPLRAFVLLALLVLPLLTAVAPFAGRAAGTAPQPSLAGLRVAGNQLLNGAGQPVRLRGVNRSSFEYACIQGWGFAEGPLDQASVDAMRGWGINAVRLPLNSQCWLGINTSASWGGASYRAAVADYVALLTGAGIAVVLDLHWAAPASMLADQLRPMPDRENAPAFWSQVATAFKGNDLVLFDLFNEPYPDDNRDSSEAWRCWRDGGSCAGVPFEAAGMQELVDAVRATGATNVIVLTGVQYGGGLDRWLEYRPDDPLDGLVASWHSYEFSWHAGDTAYWERVLGGIADRVPLLAGEVGQTDCATGHVEQALDWLDSRGASYLAWVWTDWGDCESLIADYAGTATAPYGEMYRARLALPATSAPRVSIPRGVLPASGNLRVRVDWTTNADGVASALERRIGSGGWVAAASGSGTAPTRTLSVPTGSTWQLRSSAGGIAGGARGISVGPGYADVNPKQLVRTSGNRLYLVAMECDSYPYQLGDRLFVYRATTTGVPAGFSQFATGVTDAASYAVAIDAQDDIHVLWSSRTGGQLRYRVWDTATDAWAGTAETVDSGLDLNTGQGDTRLALALDRGGTPHVVYLRSDGTRNRVWYRNRAGGAWSSATQVDSAVSYGNNEKAWLPNLAFDTGGRLIVAWHRGTFNATASGTAFTRVRAGGSWGATTTVGPSWIEIDSGASLLVTSDNRYHLAFAGGTANAGEVARYYYSDDLGATWQANHPENGAAKTHNPSLGPGPSGAVRIYGHGAQGSNDHGEDVTYWEGAGGSGSWGTRRTWARGTDYDSSVTTRWSQYHYHFPQLLDIAWWTDGYPNQLIAGSERAGTPSRGRGFIARLRQESNAALAWTGGWTRATLTGASGGALRHAASANASVTLTFTGEAVGWVATAGPDRGRAELRLDGVVVGTVDLYAATEQPRKVVWSAAGLDPGVSHTLQVRVLGAKQAASSGTRVDVDAFVVLE